MKKMIFIFLLGALASFAMAPANFAPALFIGLSALYLFVGNSKTVFKAGLTGFVFSLGYFGFGLSWIGNALLVEGNPYWWAWPFAVSGLPLILSFFTAFACGLHKYICKEKHNIGTYLSFCFFLAVFEFARGHLFTGFPWNLYGYTWIGIMPIAQVASLWNIYLLTTLTVIWAVFPGYILTRPQNKIMKVTASILIVLSFALAYAFGVYKIRAYQTEPSSDVTYVVVQPNIEQSQKWKRENIASNFMGMIEQSKFSDESADVSKSYVIIWPETAISQGLLNEPWAMTEIRFMLRSYPSEAYLITGALRYNDETKTFHNSIIGFDSNAHIINSYDKSHLVPFGEYMPFSSIVDIAPIVGFKGFEKGDGQNILELPNGIKIGALICYEIIFPQYASFSDGKEPDIFINVTNDAWYGESAGPYQHLVQAQFRAIESGRPVLRSANTGISASISPLGFVSSSVQLNQKSIINQKSMVPID